ncbi:hypothetical protein GYA49_03170 [Candidatus Beckwithbacteria bacterium]|nr:hypothetical protein [Candidatus Beckwithbacteria bacterium]
MNTCQSCGMPTDAKTVSKFDERYCIYCQDQETGKLKSYEEVRTGSIGAAIKFMGKSKEEAETMVDTMLPALPRWQEENKA